MCVRVEGVEVGGVNKPGRQKLERQTVWHCSKRSKRSSKQLQASAGTFVYPGKLLLILYTAKAATWVLKVLYSTVALYS